MDFTLKTYKQLLIALKQQGYNFSRFDDYLSNSSRVTGHSSLIIILRHDVDRKPENALKMAEIEKKYGIVASYYFRVIPSVFNEDVIKKIAKLGHEIGYHYEEIDLVNRKYRGKITREHLLNKAFELFQLNLKKIRRIYPVRTMCMHGSPLSKYSNKILWQKYNYSDYGIIGDPSFNIDFNEVFYLTDASRSWNNKKNTRRDRVDTNFRININSTDDFIKLISSENAPQKIMLNIHPHNWAQNYKDWTKILVWQSIKNMGKRIIILNEQRINML